VSVHTEFVSWGYVMSSSLYAMVYIAILLLLAIAIFSRRDFV
jgi:ABC-type transport system involved in multi-copper enzyme maturation permease subunit